MKNDPIWNGTRFNDKSLKPMSERDKQGQLYDILFSTFESFRHEHSISQASFIGVLEIFKHDVLQNWYEIDKQEKNE